MRSAYLLMGLLIATGCGSKDKDEDESGVNPEKSSVAEGRDGGTENGNLPNSGQESELPPNGSTAPAAPFIDGSLQELTGVYEQIENRQAKLRIDQNFLVITNIQLPVPTGEGSIRITPRFPHHLQQAAQQKSFTTVGYYNNGDDLWKNVELRIVAQEGTNAIDVTFVLSIAAKDSTEIGQGNTALAYDPCSYYDPCDPCAPAYPCPPPFDPCTPCQPLNPCAPCPGNGDDNEERLLLYRFEKVEVAPPETAPKN